MLLSELFQSYHSLDNAANTNDFRIQKKNFKKHIDTAIEIQLAIHAVTLAVALLFPCYTLCCYCCYNFFYFST